MSVPSREPRRWLSTEGDDLLEALRPALSSQRSAGPDPSARERIWRQLGARLPPAAEPAQNAASARPSDETPLPPARSISLMRSSWLQGAAGLALITGALAFWAAWGGLAPTRPSPRGAEAAKPRCATCEAPSAPLSAASRPGEEAPQSSRARSATPLEPMPTESAHLEPGRVEPGQGEPVQVEPVQVEPVHVEPVHVEPGRVEPVHVEPLHVEPLHVEPLHVEPLHVEPARVEPARANRVSVAPHPARMRPPASARPPVAGTTSGPSDVRSELDLLSRARRVLAADPARALALTAEHARRHRAGVLSQEREVLAIEALVRLGRRDLAASRARSFLEEHPESAHRVRLAAVLEEP